MQIKSYYVSNSDKVLKELYLYAEQAAPSYPLTFNQIRRWFWAQLKQVNSNSLINIPELFEAKILQHTKYIEKKLKGLNFEPTKIGYTVINPDGFIQIQTIEHEPITYIYPNKSKLTFDKWVNLKLKQYCLERCTHIDLDGTIYTKLDLSK